MKRFLQIVADAALIGVSLAVQLVAVVGTLAVLLGMAAGLFRFFRFLVLQSLNQP